MSKGKTAAHILTELIEMQEMVNGSRKMQKEFIKKLQQLIQSENSYSQAVDDLPFPTAVFKKNGVLIKANKALTQAARITAADIEAGRINFLNRITTENDSVLEAAENVFAGETSIAADLESPVSMFSLDSYILEYSDDYHTAFFYPIAFGAGGITCGGVTLLKQQV